MLSSISAIETLPIHIRPISRNSTVPNTEFYYTFNFTKNVDCSVVALSVEENITTDDYGMGFAEIEVSSMSFNPDYLCEYRNGTLRKVHNISIDVSQKGFFDIIGSALKRVSTIFVSNISINGTISGSGDINIGGNITAVNITSSNFCLNGGSCLNTSWNQSLGDSLYVESGGDSVINGSLNATNITTNYITSVYGFFVNLGSITNIINDMFINNINLNGTISGTGDINISGNITAQNITAESTLTLNGSSVDDWSDINLSTNPAGANTEIQLNNGGVFGASENLTFSDNVLDVNGKLEVQQTDATKDTILFNNSGVGIWANASCIVIGNISLGKGEC